ncbi:MAG TPA: hypothetical protein VL422_03415 [Miltoncostaea sp.]|nr:hypothetical protein [Miltoncostaea sp.]
MPATDDPGAATAATEHVTSPGRRRVGVVLGLAVTFTALVVAIVFGLQRDDDPGRLATAVVELHDEGPTSGRPDTVPDVGVSPSFSGYAARAGWRLTGSRTDALEGRSVRTAFWQRAGKRIAHSVVSGAPVEAPANARRTGRRGVLLQSFDHLGRTAVMWDEDGHTAVVSAIGISRPALYALAGGPRVVQMGRAGR